MRFVKLIRTMDMLVSDAQERLFRAQVRRDEFSRIISRLRSSQSWVKRIVSTPQHRTNQEGSLEFEVEVLSSIDAPSELKFIFSECIHHLRTANEQLLFSVVSGAKSAARKKGVLNTLKFPLCAEPEDYASWCKPLHLPESIQEYIEVMQPYKFEQTVFGSPWSGPGLKPLVVHPFQVLAAVSNHDKHRSAINPAVKLGRVGVKCPGSPELWISNTNSISKTAFERTSLSSRGFPNYVRSVSIDVQCKASTEGHSTTMVFVKVVGDMPIFETQFLIDVWPEIDNRVQYCRGRDCLQILDEIIEYSSNVSFPVLFRCLQENHKNNFP